MVRFNRSLCREHFLLRLSIEGGRGAFAPTRPGQFVQLGCRPPDGGPDCGDLLGRALQWQPGERVTITQPELCQPVAMLRRPFSLAGRGDDENGTWIDIIHRVVGVGTQWLGELGEGDAVDLIGPLGNWFELAGDKSLGLLVGGGVGLPPMFYLAEALHQAGWDAVAFVGATSADLLAVTINPDQAPDPIGLPTHCVDEFWRQGFAAAVTTDDGSAGMPGRITDALGPLLDGLSPARRRQTVVFTCGPEPMMHAAAKLACAHEVDCQVCLEQAMACGMGTCQSCIVKIEDEAKPHGRTETGRPWRFKLACTDGPIFNAPQVVW